MDTVAVARVSAPGQSLASQIQKILNYVRSNGISCNVQQFTASGYNGKDALRPFENPNIKRGIFTSFDRFSRDELEIGYMMKKRGDVPLTIYFLDTDQEFTISNSSPSTWDKTFTQEIQKGKIASQEKSRKSKSWWSFKKERDGDLRNAPPSLMRAGKRALRNTRKIFGYNHQTFFANYMKRQTKKHGYNVSVKNIKNMIQPLLSYNSNTPTNKLKCNKCGQSREVSREIYSNYENNENFFECSHLSFTKCSSEEIYSDPSLCSDLIKLEINDLPDLEPGFYRVDYISDKRVKSCGKIEYKVVWEGYPEDQATWLPFSKLKKDIMILEEIIRYEDQRY